MDGMTPRQKRHQKNREHILTIAKRLLIEKGHEHISLREIARLADFSPSGLYEYFENKEEIFRELAHRDSQKMIGSLEGITPDLPSEERLANLCLFYVNHAITNESMFKLMNSFSGKRRSLEMPASKNSPYIIFLIAVESLIEENKIKLERDFGAEEITYSLWALVHGMASLQISRLKNFEADFFEVDRNAIDVFIRGLLSKGGGLKHISR